MMQNNTWGSIDLQLFADGTGTGTAPAAEGGEGGAGSAPTLAKAERRGSSRRKSGEFSNVVYGKQDAAEENTLAPAAEENGEPTPMTPEERKAKFKEMIEGEFKDEYTNEFQKTFTRRHREVKGMEESLNNQKPIMDMLMQRYGITDGDMAKLKTSLEGDSNFWAAAAEEAGLTEEQFRTNARLQYENAQMRAAMQRARAEQQANAQYAEWMEAGKAVQAIYPSFNVKAEMSNPDFRRLLSSGVPMQKAYETIHMEEIMTARMKASANATAQQMTANIKSRQSRPSENGTSPNSAVIVKNDPTKWTKADRAEIARRVEAGEIIKL